MSPGDDDFRGHILGVDEAGRGPLAGPVVAAGVVLDINRPISGLNDSKKLSEKARVELYQKIYESALSVHVKEISPRIIDQINILQATLRAMGEVITSCLAVCPVEVVLIDGNQIVPHMPTVKQEAIIKGDSKVAAIMAASIIAKVHRDRLMAAFDQEFPGYGFLQHKGYGTKLHMAAIERLGPSVIHRMSFAPLKDNIWPKA
jgi:ribonuclease HII